MTRIPINNSCQQIFFCCKWEKKPQTNKNKNPQTKTKKHKQTSPPKKTHNKTTNKTKQKNESDIRQSSSCFISRTYCGDPYLFAFGSKGDCLGKDCIVPALLEQIFLDFIWSSRLLGIKLLWAPRVKNTSVLNSD